MKNNKGITLIALVITIIVMLILAGVTIRTITGGDSIPDNAQSAVDKYNDSIKREDDMLAEAESITGGNSSGGDTPVAPPGATDSEDEDIGFSGAGTEAAPYLIESIEDLVQFSKDVESGEDFSGQVVKLAQDLDFNNPDSYINPHRKDMARDDEDIELMTEMTTGEGFFPIGIIDDNDNWYGFAGTFDGQGHTIYNLYQNKEVDYLGLFGLVNNGSVNNVSVTGTIKGDVSDKVDSGSYRVGGIVGYISSDTAVGVENCTFSGTVEGSYQVAGIVGRIYTEANVTIKNCTVSGHVTGLGQVGGVVGEANGAQLTVQNCTNKAKITISKDYQAGGIIADAEVSTLNISNCTNTAEIGSTTTGSKAIAGILGATNVASGTATITNCRNSGVIKGDSEVAGILGQISNDTDLTVTLSNNTNTANIISTTTEDEYGIAGIIAHAGSDANLILNINNCVNNGNIVGNISSQAGILGNTWTEGATTLTVLNCLNTGDIGITCTSTEASGFAGIVASVSTASTGELTSMIKNCANTGAVGAGTLSSIGGIIGGYWAGKDAGSSFTISNCVNVGIITGDSDWGIGGIAGGIDSNVTPTVTNAFYLENALFAGIESDGDMLGTSKTAAELKTTGAGSVLQTLITEASAHASDTIPYLTWKQNASLYPVINI